MRRTFTYQDRLKSRKAIALVFDTGGQLFQYPIKVFYLITADQPATVQMSVSVPKKKFKKATDRNLIKRRMREAFRLNRPEDAALTSMATMWVYIGKETESYDKIESASRKLWQKLIKIQPHGTEAQQEGH
jgi:ribonuclease P protein component